MNLLIFLFISTPPTLDLQAQRAIVNPEEIIFVTENGFDQYDFEGNKLLHIPGSPEDNLIKVGDFYIAKDSNTFQTRFFSEKGKVIQVLKNTGWRSLIKLNDHLIAVVPIFFRDAHLSYLNNNRDLGLGPDRHLKVYDPGTDPNPSMLNLVHIEVENGKYQLTPGVAFFRATKEQKVLRLNFKKMFVELDGGIFYVMTELNDKIYYYDDAAIHSERSTDPRMPFPKPSLSLELKNFVPAKKNHGYPKNIYTDMDEFQKDRICWLYNWSRILHFSKEDSGFTVVYSVPSRQDDLPCDTVDIYIQELAIDGSNIGEPVVIEKQQGSFAGLIKDKLYWFNRSMQAKTGALEVINIR